MVREREPVPGAAELSGCPSSGAACEGLASNAQVQAGHLKGTQAPPNSCSAAHFAQGEAGGKSRARTAGRASEEEVVHRGVMGTCTLTIPGVQRTPLNHDPRAKIALNERNVDWTGHSGLTIYFFI